MPEDILQDTFIKKEQGHDLKLSFIPSVIDSNSCVKPEKKLWFRGVRPSKFRHVYGLPSRKESCYTDVNVLRNTNDGHVCAANPKFLALAVDSTFAIISTNQTGRIDFQSCKVIGHFGQITDLKWNPFNDNIIASAADDCSIKIWEIPEKGLSSNLDEYQAELLSHKRKVLQIEWHPTVENVLVSVGFDNLVLIWDITKPNEVLNTINCHNDTIYSMAINRDGSFIATTSKDKKLRIIEPRSAIVVSEGTCHASTKCTKVVFLDYGKVLTTGFSRHSDRQYALWDQHDLKNPLVQEVVDSSSGVITPFYDYDTKMLYLAGKGDGNIRYYEIVDESPYIHYLNQFLSGQPQKALAVLPKRGLNVHQCEIFRFYKIYATGNICEPISMIVPRKAAGFQSDLYPDALAMKPATTVTEWLSGRNIQPITMSLAYEYDGQDTNGVNNGNEEKSYKKKIDKYENEKFQNKKVDNNSKKFAFLSRETVPDYRPNQFDKILKTTTNESTKFNKLQGVFNHQTTKEISNYQNSLISSKDNSCDSITFNLTEKELRKAYANQTEEIKNLKNQLLFSEKRIQELELEIKHLTTTAK